MELRKKLYEMQDIKYREFIEKLTKTKYPLIGVRIPFLKKLAKEINKEKFSFEDSLYFEEIMVEGLLIGCLKDIDNVISRLKNFISKIDDWSVCDSCCASLKITNKSKDKMWEFITSFKDSKKEFEIRFMVVMMMNYYLEDKYISEVFNILDNVKCDFYYAKMAISWLLATALAKCEKETMIYIKRCKLDNFTFNKFISKSCESYRIKEDLKKLLKEMKR